MHIKKNSADHKKDGRPWSSHETYFGNYLIGKTPYHGLISWIRYPYRPVVHGIGIGNIRRIALAILDNWQNVGNISSDTLELYHIMFIKIWYDIRNVDQYRPIFKILLIGVYLHVHARILCVRTCSCLFWFCTWKTFLMPVGICVGLALISSQSVIYAE